VYRVRPPTVDPVFYIMYDERVIEDQVAPMETDEQSMFVTVVRSFGVHVAAVPNGGFRALETAVKLKREGMATGYPDVVINRGIPASMGVEWEQAKRGKLTHPLTWEEDFKGVWIQMPVAIEFKKRNSGLADIRDEQLVWLEELTASGWRAAVCYGAQAGFTYLRDLGFYMPPEQR